MTLQKSVDFWMEIAGNCAICKKPAAILLKFNSANDMLNSIKMMDQLQRKMFCKKCKTTRTA